ncbi:pre-B-cell leukemia transcription factor-interacting protein 1 isoform X3 [Haemorhous mexicanus]|uniref:pre-B-cell leukemia transcription factor-interacting protein 1 isoform X3 n=1 Tax=Haemorhous mexicanus TaxID=30427 RepID=UPI0028BDC0F9|nr:pre-B-cell leukemia transcription factor-interacting protein 1 isoform X3 [Haemorhous mexicanus]
MAEKLDPRDSESSWVMAGSEGLPIDTVGPEQDSASHGSDNEEPEEEDEGTQDTVTAVTASGATTFPSQTLCPEGSGQGDPEQCEDSKARAGPALDGSAEPSVLEGDEQEELNAEAEPQPCPDTAQEGGIYDVADGPVESVGSWDLAAGEQESLLSIDSNDSQQKSPLPDDGGPQNMQSMSQLLDKLAKENQEIRLMQAELQAHKEDLQALLHKSEGEAAAAGAQQQSLARENAQLRAALEREVTALREAQAELRRLQATTGAPSSPREPRAEQARATEQPRATGMPGHGKAAAWRHRSLNSLRQELADTLDRVRGSGDLKGLMEELSTLEQHLAQVLKADVSGSFSTPWKKPSKVEKESRWHKQHGTRGSPHEQERREQGKPHKKEPRAPREHKPGKAWGKPSHSHPRHDSHELPWLKRYRAPQGCSGVTDCAHKEGQEVLGVALEPVQKVQFLQLLESFMGQLGLGRQFGRLALQLDGAFRADGVFAHDRLRFVDFVDDVEDLLEDVAWQERGDKEAADGFEEYMLRHYSGTSRNVWSQRAPRQYGTRA